MGEVHSPIFHDDGTMTVIWEGEASLLAEDLILPAPGLAGEERRVRIYLPHDFDGAGSWRGGPER